MSKDRRKEIVGHLEVSAACPKQANKIVEPSNIIFHRLEHIR